MTPAKQATLFLGGALISAALSYALRRASRPRPPLADVREIPAALTAANDWQTSLSESDAAVQALLDEAAEVEIQLADAEPADLEDGDGYDTVSFDELGAQWLARATQTAGARRSS